MSMAPVICVICAAADSFKRRGRPATQRRLIRYYTRMPPQPPRSAAVTFIFVTVLIDMLAFGMIIPVLPMLVQNFVGGHAARAAEIFGVFGTAWALMQLIFSPVQGSLS